MIEPLPQPKHPFGRRLLISMIDERARTEPESPWVSIPVDNDDVSRGYKDITFAQLSNAVDHAAAWLKTVMPKSNQPFLPLAYIGHHDIRYPILTVAAGKLGYVILLPSTFITPEAQFRILQQKTCTTLLYADGFATAADQVVEFDPDIRSVAVPELDYFLDDKSAEHVSYGKTWGEAKDDPWLVFNTSGSTGFAKAITYTQAMLAFPDFLLGLGNSIKETNIHLVMNRRSLIALPLLHYVGMVYTLSMATYLHGVVVLLPPDKVATPSLLSEILHHAAVDAVVLLPRNLDALVDDPLTLKLLRSLDNVAYAGAVLPSKIGDLIASHTRVMPAIGSTDAGMYFVELNNSDKDWDYMAFQPLAGVVMEHRLYELYEMVFVRTPGALQPVFGAFPHLDKFYTSDLWSEHPDPAKKGQWKLVGRTDDLLKLANDVGLYVADLEPIVAEHPGVRSALIGGTGKSAPILIVEPLEFLKSLGPYVERVNAKCSGPVRLDPDFILLTNKDKPFPRTMKETVARLQALRLYDREIEAAYAVRRLV